MKTLCKRDEHCSSISRESCQGFFPVPPLIYDDTKTLSKGQIVFQTLTKIFTSTTFILSRLEKTIARHILSAKIIDGNLQWERKLNLWSNCILEFWTNIPPNLIVLGTHIPILNWNRIRNRS